MHLNEFTTTTTTMTTTKQQLLLLLKQQPPPHLRKPDSQRTYNVTMRYVCATILTAESVTYSESVLVSGTQHAMGICHTVICGLFGSTIFSHIISQMPQIF
jgi:hypothetical protein